MNIALLATGDELTNGDILNTNGQKIAQELFAAGFQIGLHMVVPDIEADIINCIQFLKAKHDVVIITGGLGPTSDDKTRFALAKANNLEVFFDEHSWQAIVERILSHRLKVHDSNKQQAYFPSGAEILPNPHGTAAGCRLLHEGKTFFMLPGPPKECFTMFYDHVLPYLLAHNHSLKYQQKKWILTGVSEGEIAAELDQLVQGFPVTTGYRWDYPYLEFKIRYVENADISELLELLEQRLKPVLFK